MTAQNFLDPLSGVSTAIVQVRWLLCNAVAPADMEALALLLDDGERARAARFHFERDRIAYVAAHALARVMLSAQAPLPPATWRFVANEFGRPEIVPNDAGPPLRFNLSHTRDAVAVALTLRHDVGIDVEAIDPDRFGLQYAGRIFTAAETARLRAMDEAHLLEALFELWTLKEAVVKALGRGLAVPLDSFEISFDPLKVTFPEMPGQDPSHWLLKTYAPTPAHVLALALRHPDSGSVTIDAADVAVPEILRAAAQITTGARQSVTPISNAF